jgi:hypothetical protein
MVLHAEMRRGGRVDVALPGALHKRAATLVGSKRGVDHTFEEMAEIKL